MPIPLGWTYLGVVSCCAVVRSVVLSVACAVDVMVDVLEGVKALVVSEEVLPSLTFGGGSDTKQCCTSSVGGKIYEWKLSSQAKHPGRK